MSGNVRDRRNWTRSLTIVMIVAITGAVIGCLADGKKAETNRIFLKSTAGAVLFDHGKHGQSADSCIQCHHDLYSAAQATACIACHDEGVSPDDFDHANLKEIHSNDCFRCHQPKADAKAASCRECHPGTQPSQTVTASCNECHDDSFTPEMLTHDEYLDVEDHTCLGCHAPRSVSEAYHTNCTSCHLEKSPARFAGTDGKAVCGACHLR